MKSKNTIKDLKTLNALKLIKEPQNQKLSKNA